MKNMETKGINQVGNMNERIGRGLKLILAVILMIFLTPIAQAQTIEEFSFEDIKTFIEQQYNPNVDKLPVFIRNFFGNERMNVYIDGIVAGLVSKDGRIIEVKEGEISNPTVKVFVKKSTAGSIMHSDDPATAFQIALKYGEIRVEGVGVINWVKYSMANAFGRIATKFTKPPYDVRRGEEKKVIYHGREAILKGSHLGYRTIYQEGVVFVINSYGLKVGYTTPEIQKLIETNPEELSPYTGITPYDFSEEAAQKFLEKIQVSKNSIIYVFGPVKPGTAILEGAPGGTTLEVPQMHRTYYVFIIDDMPNYKFAHPMRYAWMEFETGNVQVARASWRPVILEPETTPAPFKFTSFLKIDGMKFIKGEGGGVGITNDISHKKKATPPQIPPPTAPPDICQGRRFALVIDAGDKDEWGIFGGDAADNMAEDADEIAKWLRSEGFQVQRISQYWGNNQPCIRGGDPQPVRDNKGNIVYYQDNRLKENLKNIFDKYARNLSCCDNFFLYIGAHGNGSLGLFALYDPSGSGNKTFVYYDELRDWLEDFPRCVKFTIFIDACGSGSAISALALLRNTHSKVVILTACDATECTPSGQGLTDSATEDFNQGEDKDYDKDRKMGDLFDRWEEMRRQGKDYGLNPRLLRDPRHGNLCVLD